MSRTLTLKNYTRPAYASIQNRDIATRVNKNVFPKYTGKVPRDGLGEVELIHIHTNNDSKDIIKVTNNLTNLFKDCLILFRKDVITVFTSETDFQHEIEEIPKHIPYEHIKEVSHSSRTFVVYHNLDRIKCVLPQSTCSHFSSVLTKLENVEKRKASVVTIAIENVYKKHRERNIKTSVTQDLYSKEIPALKKVRAINISLGRSREINRLDQERVVLPRESHQNPVLQFPEPVSPSRVFCIWPILETAHNTLNLPIQDSDENLPSPAFNMMDVPDFASAVPATVPTQGLAQVPVQVQYSRYSAYTDRLTTYKGWCKSKPEPKYLSQAGFFYTGTKDLIRCFCCGIGLTDFTDDITPIKEHVRHSDQCSFLPELLSEENLSRLKKELRAKDPEYNRRVQLRELHGKYRHPDYETFEARLSSYSKWPLGLCPRLLAETGLYFTGFEAVVRCFACDGGFRKLRSTDDLWLDHSFYFPSCPFMQRKLGKRFIELVQKTVCDIFEENRHYLRKECLEMGFKEADIDAALQELIATGYSHNIGPVLDLLERNQLKKESPLREKLEAKLPDYCQKENERLRKMVDCKTCKKKANALFLPCKHHKYCLECAVQYEICPICKKDIEKKVETYMA